MSVLEPTQAAAGLGDGGGGVGGMRVFIGVPGWKGGGVWQIIHVSDYYTHMEPYSQKAMKQFH